MVENSGVLYETDLATGGWEEYGTADDFGGTKLLFSHGESVYRIEKSGGLYQRAL